MSDLHALNAEGALRRQIAEIFAGPDQPDKARAYELGLERRAAATQAGGDR